MGFKPLCCFLLLSYFLGTTFAILQAPNALTLHIKNNVTHAIPPTLYGYMWEDINHSGDGGLYAELLQNRAFQGVVPGSQTAYYAWQPFNGAKLSVTTKIPGVSAALPNSLKVDIPKVVTGPIGFENTGFWGIKIQAGWKYKGSLYARSDNFNGAITVSLKSTSGTVYSTATIKGVTNKWKKFTFDFAPTASAPTNDNVFSVLVDGSASAGKTIYFGMFSLFPPTFRGRENGMRIDLAEALADTGPSVWRFPGGNNLEGNSFDTRWKWNETIGRLEDRPGRVGNWGANIRHVATYTFNIFQTQHVPPGVWAGISIANYSDLTTWPVVPQENMGPYIQEAIDEIEFIIGDAKTTKGGKLRASLGREEPYELKFIEIGNEDFFQTDSYVAYRWKMMVDGISAKFPHLEFLATTQPSTALNPTYKKIDFHVYSTPQFFTENAFMFDNYPRNGTQFFVGEYAVTSTNTDNVLGDLPSGRLAYPTLQGATAEAAFMTGMERNSDVVFASAYAPSFQHINSYQWTPDIITYDAGTLVKSTSYYVQQMFSLNRGTHVLATSPTSNPDTAPLYWVASFNNETNAVFLKVANAGTTDLVANIFLDDFTSTSFMTTTSISSPLLSPISGIFNISNTLDQPNQIIPVHSSFPFPSNNQFSYQFPAMSVTVVSLQSKGITV
ncbi:glycoside hydrolase [Panaeolus papilionaceus]|nr:glycoside hydrolase [Panaeolus papilionaceus]